MDEAMQRRKVLIVDGYNVIRNNERYASTQKDYTSGEGWNDARDALVNDAAYLAQGRYERCTVVFDAAGNAASSGKPVRKAGIDVVFSPHGVSADSVIERLAHEAREEGFEVVVVSSDFAIQSTVYGGGVTRMSAAGFALDSSHSEQDWRNEAKQPSHVKNTVAERIDPEVAKKLGRFVRGQQSL